MTSVVVSVPEIVIAYLMADPDLMTLLNSQIGTRHKFGDDWNIQTAPGLTIRADGGIASNYVHEQRSNLEFLAWARNYQQAFSVHSEIVRIVRDTKRTLVNGFLLLSLTFETQPTQLVDPETNYPQVMFFLTGLVGENQEI